MLPYGKYILVKPKEKETHTKSGIVLAGKMDVAVVEGTVIRETSTLEEGNTVFYPAVAGMLIEKDVIAVKDENILAYKKGR